MKTFLLTLAAGSLTAVGAPALADSHDTPKAQIVAKDDQGRATRVRIGDSEYDVCLTEDQDSCINPRDAGLNFGNREIDYWPGRPASQIDQPLPLEKPSEAVLEKLAEEPVGSPPAEASAEPEE